MDEAIALLDEWLAIVPTRTTFTSDEVSDLLIDFRILLRQPAAPVPTPV